MAASCGHAACKVHWRTGEAGSAVAARSRLRSAPSRRSRCQGALRCCVASACSTWSSCNDSIWSSTRAFACSPAKPAPASRSWSMHCNWRWAAAPTRRWCARAATAPRSARSSTRRLRWLAGSTRPASAPATATARCCCAAASTRRAAAAPGSTAARRRWPSCARPPSALVDIHGQHAWQSLTRPAAVRALLDEHAGLDTTALAGRWREWKDAEAKLADARRQGATLQRERERLAWQIGEVDKLAPADGEWDEINAEHQRLAHAQALLDAAHAALQSLSETDSSADALTSRAIDALHAVMHHDAQLAELVEVLRSAQAQLRTRRTAARVPRPQRTRPRAPGRTRCAAVRLDVAGAALPARAGRTAGPAGRLEARAAHARCGCRSGRARTGCRGRPARAGAPRPGASAARAALRRRSWPRR